MPLEDASYIIAMVILNRQINKDKMERKKTFLIILCIIPFIAFSCSRNEPLPEEIARVNDVPILLKDFQREVSLASRRDPTLKITPASLEELLDTMIDKRLLIQEAVNRGISEDERFIETIKAYWEQTLIRELIAAKMKEWENEVFITEEEARSHYRRMGSKLTVRVADAESREEAEAKKAEMLAGNVAHGEELLGPLFADDIAMTNPLYEAFDMEKGEAKVVKGRRTYTAMVIVGKELMEVPEYEEIDERIKVYLLEQKKQKVFESWVEEIKESSRIEVKTGLLERVASE